MVTTICAYFLIGVFFLVIENRLRQGEEARSLQTGQFDQNSTRLVGIGVVTTFVMLLAAPVLDALGLGAIHEALSVGVCGLMVMLGGLILRVWACQTLGAFYTRTLRIRTEHHVVDHGPYRYIRHPGYLGLILMFIGASIATTNWIAIVVISAILLTAYSYRIRSEEAMLRNALGEQYKAYMARSWRLIPLVY